MSLFGRCNVRPVVCPVASFSRAFSSVLLSSITQSVALVASSDAPNKYGFSIHTVPSLALLVDHHVYFPVSCYEHLFLTFTFVSFNVGQKGTVELESDHGMRPQRSAAQRKAIATFNDKPEWYLRIEDRNATKEEHAKVLDLLDNPDRLVSLKNEALKNDGRVYKGTRTAEDLTPHQLRNLACASVLPVNGLLAVHDYYGGDLNALGQAFTKQAKGGPVAFNQFLIGRGGSGMVVCDHPAFESPDSWTEPLLLAQGMCLQAQKRPFFHPSPSTITGKLSQAFGLTSSFQGGPIGKMNRTVNSCVKVVTDRDGTSIPHCSPVSWLKPELQRTAVIVERTWAQSYLHHFPKCPGVGVFRGGDIAEAKSGRNMVTEFTSVEGRKAHVFWGNHQSLALGNADALESSARGDLELYRECKGGEGVTDEAVGDRMLDIVGGVIDIHAGLKGATDDDYRRCDELHEVRSQGLARAREVAQNIGAEIAGKVSRSTDDCAAGGMSIGASCLPYS